MSFFNKIWKNIRDKKDSHSLDVQSDPSSSSSSRHPLGQKGKTFYKRIDQLIHQQDQNEVNRKKKGEQVEVPASSSSIEDVENVAPNDGTIGMDGSDDEVILPPGIVTEMAKSKHQVSRHVSVSRSGRYKQKHRKRSNLFDVVPITATEVDPSNSDSINGLTSSSQTVTPIDESSSKSNNNSGVMITSLSLSSAFDSNDFKSIEQDVCQTVIEVEVMTTSQSLLSSLSSPSLPPLGHSHTVTNCGSKDGVTINPTFITFSKQGMVNSSKVQLPNFNFNNNSNNHGMMKEAIKL